MLRNLFKTATPPAEQWLSVAHEGRELKVRLRPSARARRFTLRVKVAEDAIVLTMPARGSVRAAQAFADRYAGWIASRLIRLPAPVPLQAGQLVPLRGREHVITPRPGMRGTVWIEEDGPGDTPRLAVAGQSEHVPRRVLDYLRRTARAELEQAAARHAATLGVTLKRISIKDTASRWGSCSSTGNLSFSWRLIMAPPHVLNYLAAHEVAHRVEMNHSARFWRIVRRLDPAMDAAELWLKRHGNTLYRYGPKNRSTL
jgi:predicted metal-dependent hydrolase